MKIFTVMPLAKNLGGAEQVLQTFAQVLADRGEKLVVVFQRQGPFAQEIAAMGHEVQFIPEAPLWWLPGILLGAVRMRRAIKRSKPDVVISWVERAQLFVGLGLPFWGGKRPRIAWWNHTGKGGKLERAVTVLPADVVLVASNASLELQESFHPKRPAVVINPSVPPPNDHAPVPPSRESLGLRGDALVVGIVGRLQEWKNQDRVIAALANLRERGVDAQLLVVGGDAHGMAPGYERTLHEMVDGLGLQREVLFTGQVESAEPYLGVIDVLVNASDPEPFGIVLLEGMNARLPVVAVDAGGPPEFIEDGVNGILVADSSPAELAAGISRLVDPAVRARLGEAGQETAQTRYSASAMTDKLLRAVEPVDA